MKKLKIIFPLFLISLLFIPKVFALNTDYNYSANYSETIQDKINNNQDKIQLVKDYIEQNGLGQYTITSNSNYVLAIQVSTIDTGIFRVRLMNYTYNSSGNGTIYSYWASNQYGTSGALSASYTAYERQFAFVDGVLQPQNNASLIGASWSYSIDTNTCNPNDLNCILDTGTYYFDTSYLNNENAFFNINTYCTGITGCKDVPVLLNNLSGDSYYVNETILVKDFYDNYNNFHIDPIVSTCPYNEIGSVIGIRDFTLEAKDKINKNSPVVEHHFMFYSYYDVDFPTDYYFVTAGMKYPSNDYNIHYELNCIDNTGVDIGSNCILSYYFYTDSEEYIDVGAIFTIQKNIPTYQESLVTYLVVEAQPPSCNFDNVKLINGVDSSDSVDVIQEQISNGNTPNLGIFSNLGGLLPPGPVDSILTIPLQVLNAINNWLTGENCTPITINLPYINRDIQLQCMRTFYYNIGATTFFEGAGTIASIVILIQYFIGLYNWVEDHMQLSHKKLKSWGTGEL